MDSLTKYLQAKKKLELQDCFTNLLQNESLDQDLLEIDLNTLKEQVELQPPASTSPLHFSFFENEQKAGDLKHIQLGEQALKKGLCGCILLAGGQGTRLNWSGPKGTFPITLIRKKSLFELFAEKVKAASLLLNRDLPLAIMTSPLNDAETKAFFQAHHFFNLNPKHVYFFSQKMLPLLDSSKRLFNSNKDEVARGPDGNGSLFSSFVEQGIYEKWKALNIQYVNTILVDNPLADPFDFDALGLLIQSKSEVVLKSCYRRDKSEKVGIIVEQNQKPTVIEYHELPSHISFPKEPPANLSLCVFNMDFLHSASLIKLPLHLVQKKSQVYDKKRGIYLKEKQEIWKYEKYLFDALPYSKKTSVMVYPREDVFSPLKQEKGLDSIETVQRDLLKREKKIYEKISLLKAPNSTFELDPKFYYPTLELLEKWKHREISSPYLL